MSCDEHRRKKQQRIRTKEQTQKKSWKLHQAEIMFSFFLRPNLAFHTACVENKKVFFQTAILVNICVHYFEQNFLPPGIFF